NFPGSPAVATITATRVPGFAEEITLNPPVGIPAGTAPVMKNIPKGQNEIKVELKTAPTTPLGRFPITFTGRTKFNNKDYAVSTVPAPLILAPPFDLTVAPAAVQVQQ